MAGGLKIDELRGPFQPGPFYDSMKASFVRGMIKQASTV